MEKRDVVEDLMSIVPAVQRAISRIVVQHGDVGVFVLQNDIDVLVRRGVGVVRIVDFCRP